MIGGGILTFTAPATVMLNSSIVSHNTATSGGGIWARTVTLNSSRVLNNTAVTGGGIFLDSGNVTLNEKSLVALNRSSAQGGGIYMYADSGLGGYSHVVGSSTSRVINNVAGGDGGGIYNDNGVNTVTQNTMRVTGNSPDQIS
jgi:hypothetical protein